MYIYPSLNVDSRDAETGGWLWWGFMMIVSAGNMCLLATSQVQASRGTSLSPPQEKMVLRVAAVVFTFVCAYRSVLPRVDVPRTCWFDTPLNWVLFGRLAATLAEVAWATQMGLVLRRLAMCLHSRGEISVACSARCSRAGILVIAFACIAECCSWTNLITENNLFAVFEQFLWSVLFLTTAVGIAVLLRLWPAGGGWSWRLFAIFALCSGLEQAYEAFGLYLPRFLEDQADHKVYQSFLPGLRQLAECHTTSQSLDVWASDAAWMTHYFSVGVWSSIWLSNPIFPLSAERVADASLLPVDGHRSLAHNLRNDTFGAVGSSKTNAQPPK